MRSLNVFDSTMLVVGCIVGVGIFRTSSSIAAHVASPLLILALWLAGGVLSLLGALCYAELAAMFPRSGGDYIYITHTYGRFWGFLFGWTKLFVERTGTIAILGFVFAEYLVGAVGGSPLATRWIASIAVLALTFINVRGIRWGKAVQNIFTVLKIAALCGIVLIGLIAARGAQPILTPPHISLLDGQLWQSLGVALVFVLWTYGGWTEAAYVAEEVEHPERDVPLAIIGGVLLTTLLYLAVNATYLHYLSVEELPKTGLVASVMMHRAAGPIGAQLIGWVVACSAFGALNGYILTGGRILYAIGQEHALFATMGTLDPERHTPALALWLNAIIAVVLIFTRTFDQIMTYSTVVISVFFLMAVVAVIVLRRREPKRKRPYRAWGYPVTPLLYAIVIIGFMLSVCLKEPREAVFGFAFLALGLPLYWLSERLGRRA